MEIKMKTLMLITFIACSMALTGCGAEDKSSTKDKSIKSTSIENIVSKDSKSNVESEVNSEDKIYGEVVDKYFYPGEKNPSNNLHIPAYILFTIQCNDGHTREYIYHNDYIAKMLNKKYNINSKDYFPKKGNNVKQLTFTKNFLNSDKNIRLKSNANNKDLIKGTIVDIAFDPGETNPSTNLHIRAFIEFTIQCNDGHTREFYFNNNYIAKEINKIYKKGDVIYIHKNAPNVKVVY